MTIPIPIPIPISPPPADNASNSGYFSQPSPDSNDSNDSNDSSGSSDSDRLFSYSNSSRTQGKFLSPGKREVDHPFSPKPNDTSPPISISASASTSASASPFNRTSRKDRRQETKSGLERLKGGPIAGLGVFPSSMDEDSLDMDWASRDTFGVDRDRDRDRDRGTKNIPDADTDTDADVDADVDRGECSHSHSHSHSNSNSGKSSGDTWGNPFTLRALRGALSRVYVNVGHV